MPGQHSQSRPARPKQGTKGGRGWLVAITAGVVVVAGVGFAAVAVRSNTNKASATPMSSNGQDLSAATGSGPLDVVSVVPVAGSTQVPTDATVSVHFSEALRADSPTPSLSPPVAGSWQLETPDTFVFVAGAPLVPSSTETVTVPGGAGGVVSADGKTLPESTTAQFTVAEGSTLRLQQLLAQLGYLPLSFTPSGPLSAPQEAAQAQEGTFTWRGNEPRRWSASGRSARPTRSPKVRSWPSSPSTA